MPLSTSARIRVVLVLAAMLIASAPAVASAQEPATLTIYSSLPHTGELRDEADDVFRGARLALEEAGGQAAGHPIRFVKLNSATAAAGRWDPGQTSANARRAATDRSTIAYLGEFGSAGSAISMPILNEERVAQVSPTNSYVGLTRRNVSGAGEPDKYVPYGERSYVRVIPADHRQAAALATHLRDLGVRRAALVDDGTDYGRGLAFLVRGQLRRRGVVLARHASIRGRARNVPAVVRALRRTRAEAMLFTGLTHNGAVALWRGVHSEHPRWQLVGAEGVAESAFTRRIPRGAARRTHITTALLHPAAYPAAAQELYGRYRSRYAAAPGPYAVYGYEAMALILDAIGRATDPVDREAVIRALFATRDRESVLGRYSIDAFGDTTLGVYGAYRVSPGGRLTWNRVIDFAR